MLKKSLIILSVFCLIVFLSTACFATNLVEGTKNALDSAGNGVEAMVNGAEGAMENAKNGMGNMMSDMGEGMQNVMDDVKDGMGNDDMTNHDTTGMTGTDDGGYNAERTATTRAISADGASAGTNSAFVWIVLAIAAVIIVALVWYYGTQTENRRND